MKNYLVLLDEKKFSALVQAVMTNVSRTEVVHLAMPKVVFFIRVDQTKNVYLVKTQITAIDHVTVTEVVVLVRLARTKLVCLVVDAINVLVRQPEKGASILLILKAPLSKQAMHRVLLSVTGFEISVV
jgi:hypothetical protein